LPHHAQYTTAVAPSFNTGADPPTPDGCGNEAAGAAGRPNLWLLKLLFEAVVSGAGTMSAVLVSTNRSRSRRDPPVSTAGHLKNANNTKKIHAPTVLIKSR